jgi:23S rRNA pseudouridine2605 synthase
VTELGSKIYPDVDIVRVDGVKVSTEEKRLYLFHKPIGVLTTLHDPFKRRCIGEFTQSLPVRVFPVGRLDLDVFGLLLLTNDGEFANRLMHPRYGAERHYLAGVRGIPSAEALEQLCRGVMLEGRSGRALSASLCQNTQLIESIFGETSSDSTSVVELSVAEGRNHFIKRILAAVGHPVTRLCRTKFGPYYLGRLAAGEIIELDFPEKGRDPAKGQLQS